MRYAATQNFFRIYLGLSITKYVHFPTQAHAFMHPMFLFVVLISLFATPSNGVSIFDLWHTLPGVDHSNIRQAIKILITQNIDCHPRDKKCVTQSMNGVAWPKLGLTGKTLPSLSHPQPNSQSPSQGSHNDVIIPTTLIIFCVCVWGGVG
jgi:hypothetical protein